MPSSFPAPLTISFLIKQSYISLSPYSRLSCLPASPSPLRSCPSSADSHFTIQRACPSPRHFQVRALNHLLCPYIPNFRYQSLFLIRHNFHSPPPFFPFRSLDSSCSRIHNCSPSYSPLSFSCSSTSLPSPLLCWYISCFFFILASASFYPSL